MANGRGFMKVSALSERLYRDPLTRDPVKQFVRVLDEYVEPSHEVLDLGAGSGQLNTYALRGRVRRIVGVDLDERVRDNPLLDEGIVAPVESLPLADNSFDLAFSIYVLEHLSDPPAFVGELRRVLRPGGLFLALTPNRYHYVALAASATPTGFHKWYNKRRGRDEEDTFPTCYQLNTRRRLKREFVGGGFMPEELRMVEVQPNYLKFNAAAFLAGTAYERLVNSSDWFAPLRVNIIAIFRNGEK